MLYGFWDVHESLAVLQEQEARRRAVEIQQTQAATTVEQLRAVALTLRYMTLPCNIDDLEDLPGKTPWRWEEQNSVEEGDWPPMPTAYALEAFRDTSILEELIQATDADVGPTVLNGDYMSIPPERERELVNLLMRHGMKVVRDDEVIRILGGSLEVG